MEWHISFQKLATAISMMPEGFGPKAMSEWCFMALMDKLHEEVQELFELFTSGEGDTNNIKTNIVRECADIFNVIFAVCFKLEKYGVLFPSYYEITHVHAPRRQRNVMHALRRIENLGYLDKRVDYGTLHIQLFLESILEFIKPSRWGINLDDIIYMMPVKALEKEAIKCPA